MVERKKENAENPYLILQADLSFYYVNQLPPWTTYQHI